MGLYNRVVSAEHHTSGGLRGRAEGLRGTTAAQQPSATDVASPAAAEAAAEEEKKKLSMSF